MNEDTLIIRKEPIQTPEPPQALSNPENERLTPVDEPVNSALVGGILGSSAAAIWLSSDPIAPEEQPNNELQQNPAPESPAPVQTKSAATNDDHSHTGAPETPRTAVDDNSDQAPSTVSENPVPELPKEDQTHILNSISEVVNPPVNPDEPASPDFSGASHSATLVGDQEINAMYVSKDADEYAEAIFLDNDGDGLYDDMYLDTDQDNVIDAYARILPDGQGVSAFKPLETGMNSISLLELQAVPTVQGGDLSEYPDQPETDLPLEPPGFDGDYDVEGDGWQ